MSSFRRHTGGGGEAVPSTRSLPGTRPWVNGQTLTSTGNRDLDGACAWWFMFSEGLHSYGPYVFWSYSLTGIVGGGLCLGTITVIEEDRFSDYALTLARYFLAQGVAAGHRCLVVGTVSTVFVQSCDHGAAVPLLMTSSLVFRRVRSPSPSSSRHCQLLSRTDTRRMSHLEARLTRESRPKSTCRTATPSP